MMAETPKDRGANDAGQAGQEHSRPMPIYWTTTTPPRESAQARDARISAAYRELQRDARTEYAPILAAARQIIRLAETRGDYSTSD